MEPADSPPASLGKTEEFVERRDFIRRSMLRANRFIGAILGMVVLLGAAMVYSSFRSSRNQLRAEQAEVEATERLWKASLDQAQAENLSTKMGHRDAALEAVRTAAQIRPSLELRNEAIAALAQRDLVPEKDWILPNSYGFAYDPDLKYYVVSYDPKVLSLYRMEDNKHVRDFLLPDYLKVLKKISVGDFQFSGRNSRPRPRHQQTLCRTPRRQHPSDLPTRRRQHLHYPHPGVGSIIAVYHKSLHT
jgi:hypothetical protein